MVSLSELARVLGGEAYLDADITGVTADSTAVAPGMMFAALPGGRTHGARFIDDAVRAGAVAVVTDEAGRQHLRGEDLPCLVLADVARQVGPIAARVYGEPARQLRSFAITGTNGKTTTSYMLDSLLREAGREVALIGGVELRVAGSSTPATLTTPAATDVQRLLATHVAAGGTDLVMEVTSHALVQHRTDPIRFSVAGFTNLTQDHLDYHDTLEEYFEAKLSLFTPERAESAVILVDDEWGRELHRKASKQLERVFALATSGDLPPNATGWRVTDAREGSFTLEDHRGERATFEVGLPGRFNISNAALAVTMALAGGVPLARIARRIAPVVPGRMETLSQADPRVVVDFAHNTAALEQAIAALQPGSHAKLVVLTGSAGDRDALKRFDMGATVARLADVVIITDDDPHGEDPAQIRDALLRGAVTGRAEVREIADRATAIREAILAADDLDTVLIAGRGHETIQEVGDARIELDDRVVARAALAERRAQTG